MVKDVKVTVNICGNETITAKDPAAYTKTLDIGPTSTPFGVALNLLFESDDTYCPVLNFTASTANDFTNQVELAPQEQLNFDLQSTLKRTELKAQDEGSHTFYVFAQSVTGKHASKEFELTNECVQTSQTVSLVDPSSTIIEVEKNLASPQSLLTEPEVAGMF